MPFFSKYISNQRISKIAPYLKGDLLDLGCDNAQVLEKYGSKINSYCGVEKSPQRIEQLKQKYPESSFIQCDLDNEPLKTDKKFDCILMIALIEHLFNQKFVMDQLAKALKPSGQIIITSPTPIGNDVVHRVGAAIGLFSKVAVDDHIVIYNRHRFKILSKEIGLNLKLHKFFQFHCNQIAILENLSPANR